MYQFFPFGDPAPFASYVFNVFDSNRDGIVNFQEFMIALCMRLFFVAVVVEADAQVYDLTLFLVSFSCHRARQAPG